MFKIYLIPFSLTNLKWVLGIQNTLQYVVLKSLLFARVVCILTGGNINSSRVSRAIDRGMAAAGRLVKFSVTIPDVPGAMAKLLCRVTEQRAEIKSFVPERAWMRRDIFSVSVSTSNCSRRTRNTKWVFTPALWGHCIDRMIYAFNIYFIINL